MHRSILLTAAVLGTLCLGILSISLLKKADARQEYANNIVALAQQFLSPQRMAAKGLPTPDRPDEAAFQEFIQTMDPALHRVPVERRNEAIRVTRNYRQAKGLKQVITGWQEKHANMGGRTRAIMYDPGDPTHKKVWAAGVTGGLWYTNDISQPDSLWHPVNDFWDNLSVCALASDPNNAQVLYAGTGEAQTAVVIYRESSGRGSGIFRSTDGGSTWNLIPSTSLFAYVTDIRVRSENGQSVIYAGVASGKYKGVDYLSQPSDGLYRSTDNGLTWTQVLPAIPGSSDPYCPSDIDISADGSRIFVGTGPNVNLLGGATILYSDSGTAGTWISYTNYHNLIQANPSYNLPGRVILASAPSNANVIYALIANGWNNGFNYYQGGYIIRSLNKGGSWTLRNSPPDYNNRNWANLAWHAYAAGVDPNDYNTLYVGGLDLHRSTNGGTSWSLLTDWALMYYGGGPDYVHADQHAIVYKPGSSAEILFGSDGGVFRTTNGNSTSPVFTERSHGLNTLQLYTGTISPVTGSEVVMGGLQDNGTLLHTGNPLTINSMVSGGDGAYCFFDKDEPNIFLTSSQYSNYSFFVDTQYVSNVYANTGVFINPSAYAWKDNMLFMNRGTFFGDNLNSLLVADDLPYFPYKYDIPVLGNATSYYSHITYSRHSAMGSPTLFCGTATGQVFKVSNAQSLIPTVSNITGAQFPAAAVSGIAVGSSNDTLMVTFSNYGVNSVWQTTNGGQSWESREGNLPDMPIRWAIYHPENNQQALLATETGVWSSSNLSQSSPWWVPMNTGMANVRVDMLQIRESDKRVLASTHGRGMFTTTYLVDPYTGTQQNAIGNAGAFPNPGPGLFTLPGTDNRTTIRVYDMQGKLILKQTGGARIDLRHAPPGTYLAELTTPERVTALKLVVAR
ncbi:MAG: T9SS type A sorting domain-containing protein [Bacteroidales bacterium]|nr:T9SS type A sorting domain-containing protein [Bacteroidales bacterium]